MGIAEKGSEVIRQVMKQYQILFLLVAFIAPIAGFSLSAKCKKPKGTAGDVIIEGCRKKICTAITVKKAVWISEPSIETCCVYNNKF